MARAGGLVSTSDPPDPTAGCALVLLLGLLVAVVNWSWLGARPPTGLVASMLPWLAIPAGGWILWRHPATQEAIVGWVVGSLGVVFLSLVVLDRMECAYDGQAIVRATSVSVRCEPRKTGPGVAPTLAADCQVAAARLNRLAVDRLDWRQRELVAWGSSLKLDYPRPSARYACDGNSIVLR